MTQSTLAALEREIVACRRCPRLVAWREQVAREKRASFADDDYWGRPVPAFGDPTARILVLGLAPAAHGANRTGRMFTGDRSGEWLYRALHRTGLANRPSYERADDGLELRDVLVTAAVRCAPPRNKPTPEERDACRSWLHAELDLLEGVRVVVALGGIAYAQLLKALGERGFGVPRPRPRFAHLAEVAIDVRAEDRPTGAPLGRASGGATAPQPGAERAPSLSVLCSYHPSQQNTFTGKLTEEMFDAVWARAKELAGL